jgi:hypothetical protein
VGVKGTATGLAQEGWHKKFTAIFTRRKGTTWWSNNLFSGNHEIIDKLASQALR